MGRHVDDFTLSTVYPKYPSRAASSASEEEATCLGRTTVVIAPAGSPEEGANGPSPVCFGRAEPDADGQAVAITSRFAVRGRGLPGGATIGPRCGRSAWPASVNRLRHVLGRGVWIVCSAYPAGTLMPWWRL